MIESPSSFWSWWLKKFPHSAYIYGHPVHWNEPNLDFLASALGELPFGIIYYAPEDRFYFRDYVFESAYRPTSPVKLTVVGKKLVNESVVGATRPQIEAAKMLFEYTDFQCFSKVKTDVKTFECNIMEAEWLLTNNKLTFKIKADRFLRNMVRAVVGTMIDVGAKKTTLEEFRSIIRSKNRSNAGTSAPAQGLYLVEIDYPKSVYK